MFLIILLNKKSNKIVNKQFMLMQTVIHVQNSSGRSLKSGSVYIEPFEEKRKQQKHFLQEFFSPN